MAATVEERLALLEARLSEIEHSIDRSQRPWFAMTIEEGKARGGTLAKRGPEQIERFRRIYGRFDGPEDLAERMRDYLYGERV